MYDLRMLKLGGGKMRAGKWIMRAITVVAVCAVLSVIVMSIVMGRRDRKNMNSTQKNSVKYSYEEKEASVEEAFTNMDITVARDMNLKIEESEDEFCHVTYYEADKLSYTVYEKYGTLVVTCTDQRSLVWGAAVDVIISIPEKKYGDITLTATTGDITIGTVLDCKQLSIVQDSGDVFGNDISTGTADVKTSSGDISMASMETKNFTVTSASGDVSLMSVNAENADVYTGAGRLQCYNMNAQTELKLSTDSGDISAQECESDSMSLITDSGKIDLELAEKYSFSVTSGSGEVSLPESEMEKFLSTEMLQEEDEENVGQEGSNTVVDTEKKSADRGATAENGKADKTDGSDKADDNLPRCTLVSDSGSISVSYLEQEDVLE
jgi:DUF4097 and DUF4098 domain-containing protein YvlB